MAGNYSSAAKAAVLAWRASQITKVSAHTADPGSTGASEVSGGGYARLTPSWGTATAAGVTAGTLVFSTSSTITHLGVWAGTTYWGKITLPAPVPAVSGAVTILSVTLDESVVASA